MKLMSIHTETLLSLPKTNIPMGFSSFELNMILIVLAMLLVLAAPALAQGPGWTANSVVTKLVVTADGGINVRLSPELTNCVSNSGYGPVFASVYPTHPGINKIKADLLAAYLNGTVVALYFTDSSCTVGEMILGGW